jgi:hypothetical protein
MSLRRGIFALFFLGMAAAGVNQILTSERNHKGRSELSQTSITAQNVNEAGAPEPINTIDDPGLLTGREEKDHYTQIKVKFTTGDYAGALQLIEVALQRPDFSRPFSDWLKAQRPVVLASIGWTALRSGDCELAIEHFRMAVTMLPSGNLDPALRQLSADTRRGFGFCLKKTGLLAGAEENLREAIRLMPADIESRLLLADLYETDARFFDAVILLQEATVGDERIARRLAEMRRKAGEGVHQNLQQTRHFNITYRAGEHETLVADGAEILELSLDEFITKAGYRPPTVAIEVVYYPKERFNQVLGDQPDWSGAFFDGRIRVPIRSGASREAIRELLRHELVHALNASMTGGRGLVPWMEEGLAQRLGQMTAGSMFRFSINPVAFAPMQDFQASFRSYNTSAANSIYQQSLYLLLTLEQLDHENIRRVVMGLSPTADLSQDAVLAPTGHSFSSLYQQASQWWTQRTPLAAR